MVVKNRFGIIYISARVDELFSPRDGLIHAILLMRRTRSLVFQTETPGRDATNTYYSYMNMLNVYSNRKLNSFDLCLDFFL